MNDPRRLGNMVVDFAKHDMTEVELPADATFLDVFATSQTFRQVMVMYHCPASGGAPTKRQLFYVKLGDQVPDAALNADYIGHVLYRDDKPGPGDSPEWAAVFAERSQIAVIRAQTRRR